MTAPRSSKHSPHDSYARAKGTGVGRSVGRAINLGRAEALLGFTASTAGWRTAFRDLITLWLPQMTHRIDISRLALPP
jgi:hypothetical protein